MRRHYLAIGVLVLLAMLAGCSPPLTPVPPPGPSFKEPELPPRYLVGIGHVSSELPNWQLRATESKLYPLQGAPEFVVGTVETLAREVTTGTVRLALAHPVDDLFDPPPLDPNQTGSWVLLTPGTEAPSVSTWLQVREDSAPDGSINQVSATQTLSQVVPFGDTVKDLEATRISQGLWVDAVLMEFDSQDTKVWKLYLLAGPGTSSGEGAAVTVCCRWLSCDIVTGAWRTACQATGCTSVCQ